jgi:hypothetical protein
MLWVQTILAVITMTLRRVLCSWLIMHIFGERAVQIQMLCCHIVQEEGWRPSITVPQVLIGIQVSSHRAISPWHGTPMRADDSCLLEVHGVVQMMEELVAAGSAEHAQSAEPGAIGRLHDAAAAEVRTCP